MSIIYLVMTLETVEFHPNNKPSFLFDAPQKFDGLPPLPMGPKANYYTEIALNRYNLACRLTGNAPIDTMEYLPANLREVMLQLRLGSSAANSFMQNIEGNFPGTRENWYIAHHGHDHDTKVERWMNTFVTLFPKLYEDHPEHVYSLSLFSKFHDLVQVLWYEQNRGTEREEKSREGHATGSALTVAASWKRFSDASGIPESLSKKITGLAALLILAHDYSEGQIIHSTLHPQPKSPAHSFGRDEDLYRASLEGNVDITTFRKKDLYRFQMQEKNRFDLSGKHGLPTVLDQLLDNDLEAFSQNEELIVELSAEEKRLFRDDFDIVLTADLIEMLYPPGPQLLRKLEAPKSWPRMLFDGTADEIIPALTQSLHSGNLERKNKVLHSDLGRTIAEWFFFLGQTKESPLFSREEFIYFRKVILATSVATMERIGNLLLRGKIGEAIDPILDALMIEISGKITSRLPPETRIRYASPYPLIGEEPKGFVTSMFYLRQPQAIASYIRGQQFVLGYEKAAKDDNLLYTPKGPHDTHKKKPASPRDARKEFNKTIQNVWKTFVEEGVLTAEEIQEYRTKYCWQYQQAPTPSLVSLGQPQDATLLFPLSNGNGI